MTRTLLVVSAVLSVMIMGGCAKRPATTQTVAPAPTGPAPTAPTPSRPPTPAVAAPALAPTPPPRSPAAGPAAAVRPAPKEFEAAPELGDIHFDFDKYNIRPNDANILDANAAWLKKNANYLLLIEGHCDERGTGEYNIALGERRAKATMNHLVSQGVSASRISIVSHGEERPVCTEHNEACWAKNRRAHFLVKPQ